MIWSASQPSWIGVPLEIFKITFSRRVAFPVVHFFRRCFFQLCDFVKRKTPEIPRMCSISYCVIKHRSANHLWRYTILSKHRQDSSWKSLYFKGEQERQLQQAVGIYTKVLRRRPSWPCNVVCLYSLTPCGIGWKNTTVIRFRFS